MEYVFESYCFYVDFCPVPQVYALIEKWYDLYVRQQNTVVRPITAQLVHKCLLGFCCCCASHRFADFWCFRMMPLNRFTQLARIYAGRRCEDMNPKCYGFYRCLWSCWIRREKVKKMTVWPWSAASAERYLWIKLPKLMNLLKSHLENLWLCGSIV